MCKCGVCTKAYMFVCSCVSCLMRLWVAGIAYKGYRISLPIFPHLLGITELGVLFQTSPSATKIRPWGHM